MDLSIIIVNWNSVDYLNHCIASILSQTRGLTYEIIVIDSGSYDGCDHMLRELYPKVHFIQSQSNLGFARANNAAYSKSIGESLLFLNPDTEIQGDAINVMYEQLHSSSDVGAVGCKLLNSDGSIQTSCIQSFPNILNQVLDSNILRQRFPNSQLWGVSTLNNDCTKATEVDVISGACLMISRQLFEKLGMFNSDYFMYSDEVDLCYKSHHAHKRNYYVPNATVVHHGGSSSDQHEISTFSSVMVLESRWRYFCNTKSSTYGSLYRVSILVVSLVRMLMAFILSYVSPSKTNSNKWRLALSKWKAKFRWAIGLEQWTKKYSA